MRTKLILFVILLNICALSCESVVVTPCGTDATLLEAITSDLTKDSIGIDTIGFEINWSVFIAYSDTINTAVEKDIFESFKELNKACKGYVKHNPPSIIYYFKSDKTVMDAYQSGRVEDRICEGLEDENRLNLFVLNNDVNLNGYSRLPVAPYRFDIKAYDRILLSYRSMSSRYHTTLTHEFGHNMGLVHTFDDCRNFMSYDCYRDRFNDEQLEIIVLMLTRRSYLMYTD